MFDCACILISRLPQSVSQIVLLQIPEHRGGHLLVRLNSGDGPLNQRGAFSVHEFCEWAGIGRTKAFEQIAAGRLRASKIGKRTLIRITDAEAWLESLPSTNAAQAAHHANS